MLRPLLEQFNDVKKQFNTDNRYDVVLSTDLVWEYYFDLLVFKKIAELNKDDATLKRVEAEINHCDGGYNLILQDPIRREQLSLKALGYDVDEQAEYKGYPQRYDVPQPVR